MRDFLSDVGGGRRILPERPARGKGGGVFHIHPVGGAVTAIEVEAGDLIRVPRGTWHWFDLCSDRQIRAIRLFQDQAGWTPVYTESAVETKYEPVCFGLSYVGQ